MRKSVDVHQRFFLRHIIVLPIGVVQFCIDK